MNILNPLFKDPSYIDIGLLLLRLAIGTSIALHSLQIAINPETLTGLHAQTRTNLPSIATYGIYIGEFVALILLILGIFSRLSAAVISGNMLFVIVLAYQPELFTFNNFSNHVFEPKLLFLLGTITIALLGSGRYALIQD